MRKKLLRPAAIGIVLIVILVAAYGYVGAKKAPQLLLTQLLIQEDSLPEGATVQSGPHILNNMPGPLSHVTLPFQSEGFVVAANTDILYPIVLANGDPGYVYVANIVYQFKDAAQAKAVLQRQPEFLMRIHKPGFHEVTVVELERLTTAYEGTFICQQYSLDNNDNQVPFGEGLDLETCSFFGVKDNLLTFLMLDGFYIRDATSQQILEDLAIKLLER
ncbi:MAG: hypothetical protein ACP5J4_21640 [Anaerolineae bacterium]